MPQSLARILVHLVFSTKNRTPNISEAVQPKLHAYLAGTLNKLSCPSIQVGGVDDHVHLLFSLSRTITIADAVKELKTGSSKWMKATGGVETFNWQGGYGGFSVSESQRDDVITYIQRQKEHHQKMTFKEEFRKLCHRNRIEIDERFVWD